MALRTLDIFLSGGAANSNPNASLGGIKSSVKLYGQTLIYSALAMAGVTLVDAAGVTTGTLHFIKATNLLGFQKAGGAVPTAAQSVSVAVNGTYSIECPETGAFVTVTVTFASLPATDITAAVTATSINQNLFDDVTVSEAEVGAIEYRHFYITNITAGTVLATLYIFQQFTGLDYLELGVKQLTTGWVDELLPNSATAPAGITFYPVATKVGGLFLTLAPSDSLGVFVKRTVTALSDVSNASDTAILSLSVSV